MLFNYCAATDRVFPFPAIKKYIYIHMLKKTIETITEIQMVFTTITITNITNHQLLTIKTIKKHGTYLGHIPLGFIGFIKPPTEGD